MLLTSAQLLGIVWNWTLYGVLITQFCRSFDQSLRLVLASRSSHSKDVHTYNFPDDGKRLKYLGRRALDTLRSFH
jgi:hypothetical protein